MERPDLNAAGGLAPGQLARNAGLNMMGLGLPVLVALAAMPVLARTLEPAQFGLLGIAWLVLGYANELGFGRATTKFVAESLAQGGAERMARVAWTTIALQAAAGVLAAIALAAATPLLAGRVLRVPPELAQETLTSFYLLAVTIPLIVSAAAVRGILEAHQRFDLVNAVRGPVAAANFLLPLAGIVAGLDLAGIVLLLLVGRALALAAYMALALRIAPALRRVGIARRAELGTLLRFGGWTSLSGVVSPLLIYLDRFLLGALLSMAAVAYYTASYEIVARLLIVPASLVGTLFPAFSTLHGRGDPVEAARLGARGIRYTVLLTAPVAVVLIAGAPDLLSVWLGSSYAQEGAVALQLLAVGIVVNAVAHVPVSLLHGMGRADLPGWFHVGELPVHLVVAFVLIRAFGVPGAALAWCLRVALDAGLLLWAAGRVTPLSRALLVRERVPRLALTFATLAALGAASAQLGGITLRAGGAVLLGGLALVVTLRGLDPAARWMPWAGGGARRVPSAQRVRR